MRLVHMTSLVIAASMAVDPAAAAFLRLDAHVYRQGNPSENEFILSAIFKEEKTRQNYSLSSFKYDVNGWHSYWPSMGGAVSTDWISGTSSHYGVGNSFQNSHERLESYYWTDIKLYNSKVLDLSYGWYACLSHWFDPDSNGSGFYLCEYDTNGYTNIYMHLDKPANDTPQLKMVGRADYYSNSAPIDVQLSKHMTFRQAQNDIAPIPLPGAAPLLLAALGGLVALRRRTASRVP